MGLLFLVAAVILDVAANVALKYSQGFRKKGLGILALFFIMAAFACLAQALRDMDLSAAYVMWGAAGLCLTALGDRWLFGQQFTAVGWLGLAFMVWGVTLLHSAS